jgi:GABA(A) receptor-associated protein
MLRILKKPSGAGQTPQFQKDHTFDERKNEATRVRNSYPDRVPCIVEVKAGNDLPQLDKRKYLIPKTLTWPQFLFVLRKRLRLRPDKALFIFVNNIAIAGSSDRTIGQWDKEHRSDDGFLYVFLAAENAFGSEWSLIL